MTEITAKPFDWNDNLSKEALEDFEGIRKDLPYCTCQNIGMALAKLELLEEQGQELRTGHWIKSRDSYGNNHFTCPFCGHDIATKSDIWEDNYCSNCGERMFEPQEGGDQE